MRKTTSQQLIDSLGYEDGAPGQPLVLGATLDQTSRAVATTAGVIYSVPIGSVLLITHIAVQIDQSAKLTLSPVTSPEAATSIASVDLLDQVGIGRGSIAFRGFYRYQGIFASGLSPDFRASQPGQLIQWKPKYPIPVPSGWTVRTPTSGIDWGNQAGVYGVLVSESACRQMGYSTSSVGSPSTERRRGLASAASTSTMVTGRAGKCIHIVDTHIRVQPETNVSNSVVLQQGDGTQIFKLVNDNPAELVETQFSPGWYLKAGEDLDVVFTVANSGSVNVSFEFVDEDEVPGDSWFSVVEPDLPTPGVGTIGLFSATVTLSTEATLYYAKPRADGSHTSTSPNKGFQHMLRGYAVSMQKSVTTEVQDDDTEQTRLTISTGATAGSVELSALSITQTNLQLAPVFSASSHDQCTHGVVEGVNLPCKADDGSLWVDTMQLKATLVTPTSGDADIRDWAVSMWGTTIPTKFSPRTNQGT